MMMRNSLIKNYTLVEKTDDEGNPQTLKMPTTMSDIIDNINVSMNGWPRRLDNMLFVDDSEHGLAYFDRRTTAGLFGWLRRHCNVQWTRGGSFVTQAELFAECERTAQRYDAIEMYPHQPPIENVYYRCREPEPGDGSHLRNLLNRFRPETTIDRDLIQAMVMTVFWGGLPGCRPAFVITSDYGRGVGKSKLAEMVAYLCGGALDIVAGEDATKLKERLLSPPARTKRVAILDNVKTLRFSWAELEALVTSPVISGHQKYVGEGQRPNLLTWFIALNGVSMATDMAQRSVIIKLSGGENAGGWVEDTRRYIDQHRNQIIGDIIAALRGEQFELATYSRWASWEQDILRRLPEPAEAQSVIIERQSDANCELDEAEIIESHFAEQLRCLDYDPERAQVRIPVGVVARWFGWAVGEKIKTAAASKRLSQMATEGQIRRLESDRSRSYGRCFIWTGARANISEPIANDLQARLAQPDST